MKNVREWGNVAYWIGIPDSKRYELRSQNPTTDLCKQACWDYWIHHHLAPSWRILASGLYLWEEHGALKVLQMNYLKGESIGAYHSPLGNWALFNNHDITCNCNHNLPLANISMLHFKIELFIINTEDVQSN